MIFNILGKILNRSRIELSSLRFRMRFSIFTGKIRSDIASVPKSAFGKRVNARGCISSSDSSLVFGDACSMARTSEIGAEKNGSIVVGSHVSFGPRTIVTASGSAITIGSRTTFFSDCLVSGSVAIGKDCLFAKNVTVLSSTHQIYGDGTIRENDASLREDPDHQPYSPVTIGDDCWLGINSVILPGVTLGKGTVVGANAVVTKDFPEYSIVGGVPATIIGSRIRKD